MALQVRGREYGCFYALLPTPTRVAMMVGAHNTVDVAVECQVHMGDCIGFFRKGGCRYLQNTIVM